MSEETTNALSFFGGFIGGTLIVWAVLFRSLWVQMWREWRERRIPKKAPSTAGDAFTTYAAYLIARNGRR